MDTPPQSPTPTPAPTPTPVPPEKPQTEKPSASPPHKKSHTRLFISLAVLILIIAATVYYLHSLNTVSTDDAYVNGHVTFVAPRVAGKITRVFVDDNNRVRKGDPIVQIDTAPFDAELNIATAAVAAAQADFVIAQNQARATMGQMRSLRFSLEHAIEDVDNQIALLRSKIAALHSQSASLTKAQADFDRAVPLLQAGNVSKDEFDQRKAALEVAQARVEESLQQVYQVRVSLGLPAKPTTGDDLAQVPDDLDQNFSSVRQAQASLIQAAATLGVTDSLTKSPKQMIADFLDRDPSHNLDIIYDHLIKNAPGIKQADSKLQVAIRNQEQAALNLSFCTIYADIDGVISRREVNPGNYVVTGQSLMTIRSLSDIWIDANFKETQLAQLRIGLPVDIDVDMYGSHHTFKGRISGFSIGTGSSLALLPAENATGNYVKVVQRLPVRIDLLNYDPEKNPLFIGLSVTPRVHIDQPPAGPHAGAILQPYTPAPAPTTAPATSK